MGASRFDEQSFRHAAMGWLDAQALAGQELLTSGDLSRFTFEGQPVRLMDAQRGIRKPAQLDSALSIRTTFTPPGQSPPYVDAEGADGLLRYKYRGDDPSHSENAALRRAMNEKHPLIWFVGVAPALYLPVYPVWLVSEERDQRQFAVALDGAQRYVPHENVDPEMRKYVQRLTKVRLHQPLFRSRVLHAYGNSCAICRLRHVSLIDASHILPDGHPRGEPIVPNGLALCKIHHSAYDQNILGVRPDLIVEVRRDLMDEVDGPMLLHGLQEMAGTKITVPETRSARPDRERLELRYHQFRHAA